MQHPRIAAPITAGFVLATLAGCGANRPARAQPDAAPPHRTIVPPPCSAPADLSGTEGPFAPGFIVALRDTVNTSLESARLARKYAFTVVFVWPVFHIFSTSALGDTTVAAIRCEPAVHGVSYNGLLGPAN